MPQEFQALHCYNCKTFQVEIIKKVPKWVCKICNEKQSVKQIFMKGTSKDCRLFIQDANAKLSTFESEQVPNENVNIPISQNQHSSYNFTSALDVDISSQNQNTNQEKDSNKWKQFLESSDISNVDEEDAVNSQLTFIRPEKRKRNYPKKTVKRPKFDETSTEEEISSVDEHGANDNLLTFENDNKENSFGNDSRSQDKNFAFQLNAVIAIDDCGFKNNYNTEGLARNVNLRKTWQGIALQTKEMCDTKEPFDITNGKQVRIHELRNAECMSKDYDPLVIDSDINEEHKIFEDNTDEDYIDEICNF